MKLYAVQERIPNGKGKAIFTTLSLWFKRQNAEREVSMLYDTMRDLHDYYIVETYTEDEIDDATQKLSKIRDFMQNIFEPITMNEKKEHRLYDLK